MRRSLLSVSLIVFLLSACSTVKQRGWDRHKTAVESASSTKKVAASDAICASPYHVGNGDTLSEIAKKCGVDMDELADRNDISPPYSIYVGQELNLPSTTIQTPKPQKSTPLKTIQFTWPSEITKRQFVADGAGNHVLIIPAEIGEGVFACEDGEVVYAGDGIQHYGKMVLLKHPNGYLTIYAHNEKLSVSEGQMVKKGQLIALVGATGNAKTPQLYVEVRYKGRKVDAKPLFPVD